MKHTPLLLTLLGIALLAVACSDDGSIVGGADLDLSAASAKPATGSGTPNSLVEVTLDDSPEYAMVSDRNGPYTGGSEGVHATILYHDPAATGGSFIFDPDKNNASLTRTVSITINGVTYTGKGPYFDLKGVMQVTEASCLDLGVDCPPDVPVPGTADAWLAAKYGDVPISRFRVNPVTNTSTSGGASSPDWRLKLTATGIPNCDTILFEDVSIRRDAGAYGDGRWSVLGGELGAWAVASTGPAVCRYTPRGSRVPIESAVSIPFRMTLAERRP